MKTYKPIKILVMIILVIIVLLAIYFNIPYSPLKKDFDKDVEDAKASENNNPKEIFTADDFKTYPHALQMYIKNNGYLSSPKMNYINLFFKDVSFYQSPERKLIIGYNQYNFAHHPIRLAFIDASMAGIPFEGYDYYINGQGGMHGMLGKSISLFHERGKDMDQGALCTYLSESVLVPSSILYNDIIFEEIEPLKLKASLTDKGNTVSGIFTFNEAYEITQFYTMDRPAVKDDGSVDYIPWSASFEEYKRDESGINRVAKVKVSWHYPDGDFDYFVGDVHYLNFY